MHIKYSPGYLNDLRKIYNYISDNLKNPIAAKNVVSNIRYEVNRLQENPNLGLPLKSLYDTDCPFFRLLTGNYVVIYGVEKEEILVLNIYGTRQNYMTRIEKRD